MTQSDATPGVDAQLILQSVMRAIAENPTGDATITLILHHALKVAFADAGLFVVFDEAELMVPYNLTLDDVSLPDVILGTQDYMRDLYIGTDVPELFGNAFKGWMLIPIEQDDHIVGALILLYGDHVEFEDTTNDTLGAFLDSLKLITFVARLKAQQHRHNRNQHEFLRIVTHDMRSPLTSMQGFGSMLESQMAGDLNEKQSHFVEKIMSGIAQLTLQIDNMQDAGRYDPETGFYEMSRAPTDLIDLAQKVVNDSLLPAEKQNLQITLHNDEFIPIINVDSAMIERSVVNLVDNAIKYTPDGGRVDIYLRLEDDNLLIVVEDTGLGINPEDIDKLFDRHFRIRRKEHRRIKGSGLGLFIVRSVARKHGGDAWAESIEGEGSKFVIRIPLDGKNLIGGG